MEMHDYHLPWSRRGRPFGVDRAATNSNRFLSTGGGGLAINSGSSYIPNGVIVGVASGITYGGPGSFNTKWDAAFLKSEGVINWQATNMFSYQAHHELVRKAGKMLHLHGEQDNQSVAQLDSFYSLYLVPK
ncbi:8912802b-ca0e-4692-9d12-e1882a7f93ef [Thermothielavioides terrestris]|uniref:8912802b-ca0e-4692-9d12-e1882a7f93ef n=1 Tax=Thermothielavioides terrestris TaxID=2587410 RepID=A0A3S4ETR3_9PEZI|nr:8912802b-ca0e-4692-9d12-e1882a7f93ef [Thermothielavioides terrestris]